MPTIQTPRPTVSSSLAPAGFGILALVVGLWWAAFVQAADDAAFEAEIQTGASAMAAGRIVMSGSRYRLELQGDGEPTTLIVDGKRNDTVRVDTRRKRFHAMPTRSRECLALNPIEAFRLTAGFYPRQPAGEEMVSGLPCRKSNFLSNGKVIMSAWLADDLPIPVKVVHHRFGEMNFELRRIRKGPVAPTLLAVPPGFVPDGDGPTAGSAPGQWNVPPGGSQTIPVVEGQAVSLIVADNPADGQATRGKMIFLRNAPPPVDRVEAPLKLPNGKSFDLAYPASARIKAIEFRITQGGIQVKQAQPR